MIIEIGHFSVVIALVLAVFGIVSSGLALRTRNADWVRAGRMALTLIFILLSVGMAALIYSFLARDFFRPLRRRHVEFTTPLVLHDRGRLGRP